MAALSLETIICLNFAFKRRGSRDSPYALTETLKPDTITNRAAHGPFRRSEMKRFFTIRSGGKLLFSVFCFLFSHLAAAQSVPNLTRSLSGALGAQARILWVDGTANLFRTVTKSGVATQENYTTTREGIADIVRKARAAHINRLVVDVKPLSGEVLYNSKIAPHTRQWQGKPVPDFDVLAAFIAEGHKAGLRVDAAINILSEGHKLYNIGPAYAHPEWQSIVLTVDRGLIAPDAARMSVRVPDEPDDPTKATLLEDNRAVLTGDPNARIGLDSGDGRTSPNDPGVAPYGQQFNISLDAGNRIDGMADSALLGDDPLLAAENGRLITVSRDADRQWCSAHLKPDAKIRFDVRNTRLPIAQAPHEKIACFVNALNPAPRSYELSIVREIVTNYRVDGLVLDRCRYSNIYNDFSDVSRAAFAHWLHKPVRHWPEDVYAFAPEPGEAPVHGPLFKPWLEFRAQVIRNFVAEVARLVRTVRPDITLGTYVGSWYPSYFGVGVNWGSEQTDLRYDWQTDAYPRTGYAEFFDWITTGCYHPVPFREDARRAGLSEKGSVEYLADVSTEAVANGAWVYPGLFVTEYDAHPENLLHAIEAANRHGQGWMIFDLSYIEADNYWSMLEKASVGEAVPPDALKNLLPEIRAAVSAASK